MFSREKNEGRGEDTLIISYPLLSASDLILRYTVVCFILSFFHFSLSIPPLLLYPTNTRYLENLDKQLDSELQTEKHTKRLWKTKGF